MPGSPLQAEWRFLLLLSRQLIVDRPLISKKLRARIYQIFEVGVIAKSIKNGDTVVEEIVKQACQHIGTAVSSIVHLMAPDIIVLGGGLVEAMLIFSGRLFLKSAQKQILDSFVGSFEIKVAELGDDAAVLGAASWAEHNFKK